MLSFEDFKTWLTEQDGNVRFSPVNVCNCPIAKYASARLGQPCMAAYDEIWPMDGPPILRDDWIFKVISVVDENNLRPLSAKEVLALI